MGMGQENCCDWRRFLENCRDAFIGECIFARRVHSRLFERQAHIHYDSGRASGDLHATATNLVRSAMDGQLQASFLASRR
jgi:hypothetical protein